jgi:hypothetical protein
MAIKAMGHSPAGCFGFSHLLGGYWCAQAEYLLVPMADEDSRQCVQSAANKHDA